MRRIIRHPRDKRDLATLALAGGLVLDVEDRVPAADPLNAGLVLALGRQQLLAEFAVVRVRGRLFHHDLFPVVADFVDDPFRAFAQLQLVEGLDAFGRNGYSVRALLVSLEGRWEWDMSGWKLPGLRLRELGVSGVVLVVSERVRVYHVGPPVRAWEMFLPLDSPVVVC